MISLAFNASVFLRGYNAVYQRFEYFSSASVLRTVKYNSGCVFIRLFNISVTNSLFIDENSYPNRDKTPLLYMWYCKGTTSCDQMQNST